MNSVSTHPRSWVFSFLAFLTTMATTPASTGEEHEDPGHVSQAEQTEGKPSSGTQLNPSVLLFHKPQYNKGVQYVRRAAELGCRHVNVVVTLFCEINAEREVISYGVLQGSDYVKLNDTLRSQFQISLRQVFSEAVAQGMELTVLAHLNSWGEIDDWRNLFKFDPLVRYGKYNYQEAMIDSVVDALAEAIPQAAIPQTTIPQTTVVDFSLVGEMGNSLFTHAASYRKLMDALSRRKRSPKLRLGLGLNFNNVTGDHLPTNDQREQVQMLIDRCDFIGLSDYRWFDLPPEPADFEEAIRVFLQEMEKHGAKVPREMPLHFTEVGIGGGTEAGLAKTPAEAAVAPWEGSDDPNQNPWKPAAMQKFRVEFHQALLNFLAHQPTANRVTKAFLWSEGSWDPMGIIDQHFADEQIIKMIREHNDAVAK